MKEKKIVVFTCNWNPYSGMETAGRSHIAYSHEIFPVRVPCLGRLDAGIVLKAFQRGAAGVMMLGCSPDECRHGFGSRGAESAYSRVRDLIRLLGFHDSRLQLTYMPSGDGDMFVETVGTFVAGLNGNKRP